MTFVKHCDPDKVKLRGRLLHNMKAVIEPPNPKCMVLSGILQHRPPCECMSSKEWPQFTHFNSSPLIIVFILLILFKYIYLSIYIYLISLITRWHVFFCLSYICRLFAGSAGYNKTTLSLKQHVDSWRTTKLAHGKSSTQELPCTIDTLFI